MRVRIRLRVPPGPVAETVLRAPDMADDAGLVLELHGDSADLEGPATAQVEDRGSPPAADHGQLLEQRRHGVVLQATVLEGQLPGQRAGFALGTRAIDPVVSDFEGDGAIVKAGERVGVFVGAHAVAGERDRPYVRRGERAA